MATDKHTTEHTVLEALSEPGCALCALNRSALEGWIDSLLREGITNVKSRLRFREAGGLCREHGRLLDERGNPLGVAILMEDLFTQASPARQNRRARVHCAACGYLRETESRYLEALARALGSEEARSRYAASPGLCVPHVRRLLRSVGRSVEGWLRDTAAAHLEPLSAELQEIIRKHDYRYQGEGWGDEADAWRRAVALWSGDCVAEE